MSHFLPSICALSMSALDGANMICLALFDAATIRLERMLIGNPITKISHGALYLHGIVRNLVKPKSPSLRRTLPTICGARIQHCTIIHTICIFRHFAFGGIRSHTRMSGPRYFSLVDSDSCSEDSSFLGSSTLWVVAGKTSSGLSLTGRLESLSKLLGLTYWIHLCRAY